MFKRKHVSKWLVAAFILETFCVSYGLKIDGIVPFLAILYFITGIAIAILWLFYAQADLSLQPKFIVHRKNNNYRLILWIAIGVMMCHFGSVWIEDNPLSINDADMLPIIKIMGQRFINGHWKQVYDNIPEIWGGTKPIYLPALWLPFTIPQLLHIDIRWATITILFFCFGCCIWLIRFSAKNKNLPWVIVTAFVLFWWLFTSDAHGLVPFSEEGVAIGYYVLLALALLNGNIWRIGIAISLCALSRYSLVGFIPAIFMYLMLEKQYKNGLRLMLTGISCFLILFLLPFGWGEFMNLLKLPGAYVSFAARVWNDSPIVFSSSLGFARFFSENHIALQHSLLTSLSFILPMLFMLFCFYLKSKRHQNINNIALATLKIALVVFYCFIDVPYLYLFYTSSFVSLIGVAYFISRERELKNT